MTGSETYSQVLSKSQLGLQDLQAFHKGLDEEKHFDQDIFRNVAYLSAEIGELVSAIRVLRKVENPSDESDARIHAGEELADCLAYIVKLANYLELDLHGAYVNKMRQNANREWHEAIR